MVTIVRAMLHRYGMSAAMTMTACQEYAQNQHVSDPKDKDAFMVIYELFKGVVAAYDFYLQPKKTTKVTSQQISDLPFMQAILQSNSGNLGIKQPRSLHDEKSFFQRLDSSLEKISNNEPVPESELLLIRTFCQLIANSCFALIQSQPIDDD